MKHVVFDEHSICCPRHKETELTTWRCATKTILFFINKEFYLTTMYNCYFSLDFLHEILAHIAKNKIKKDKEIYDLKRGVKLNSLKNFENLSKIIHTEVCYVYGNCALDFCFSVDYKYLEYNHTNEQLGEKYNIAKKYIEEKLKTNSNIEKEILLNELWKLYFLNLNECNDEIVVVKTTENLIKEINKEINQINN
jgi:hypothetical protein